MRVSIDERARKYLATMPPARSGSNGHDQTFAVACVLVKGFGLSVAAARPLMEEYNRRCEPPWSDTDLEHKLLSADASEDKQQRGYLLHNGEQKKINGTRPNLPPRPRRDPVPPHAYDVEKLSRFAGDLADKIDLVWLANRSRLDPATVDCEAFLQYLYRPGEQVVIFTVQESQGQAVWPHDALPATGPHGVWFLAQPVDGEYHPNPRRKNPKTNRPKLSRRSAESVTSWRYMVIESDSAPPRLWLAALVRLPLRISAIYTSGGKSVHALVRVDAKTEGEWNEINQKLQPGLRVLGADKKALTSVRLTRLPGCTREEKKSLQKLLYIQPSPIAEPLVEMAVRRDVEATWLAKAAELSRRNWPREGVEHVLRAVSYYRRVSTTLDNAAKDLEDILRHLNEPDQADVIPSE